MLNHGSRASASSWVCAPGAAAAQGPRRGAAVTERALPALDKQKQAPGAYRCLQTNEPKPSGLDLKLPRGDCTDGAAGLGLDQCPGGVRTCFARGLRPFPGLALWVLAVVPQVLPCPLRASRCPGATGPHPAATPEVTPVTSGTGGAPQTAQLAKSSLRGSLRFEVCEPLRGSRV